MKIAEILINGTDLHTLNQSRKRWVLGRDPTCDIQIIDPSVSRKHCTIVLVTNSIYSYQVFDGLLGHARGSKYGVFVNDVKRKSAILNNGDIVRLSPNTSFQFIVEEAVRDEKATKD